RYTTSYSLTYPSFIVASFFIQYSRSLQELHSFPTRRSSDLVKSSVFLYLFTGLLDSFATFKLSLFQTSGLKHKLWSKKSSIIFCILTVSGFILYSSFLYVTLTFCIHLLLIFLKYVYICL